MGNKVHPKMDRENRAKQFMRFDALKGFREVLAEKERQIAAKRDFSEERRSELDHRLIYSIREIWLRQSIFKMEHM